MGIELKGGDKLQAYLDKIGKQFSVNKTVRAGFLENAKYPDGTPVATIAALMDAGVPSKGIPPRPFMRNVIARRSPEWGKILMDQIKRADGNVDVALAKMGLIMAGQIRESIIDMTSPANSPVTNLLKQRFPMGQYEFSDVKQAWRDVTKGVAAPAGKPLVWTGHMLASVDSEVTDG